MIETRRHGMPTLVPGQMNREVTINSALQIADAMMNPVIEDVPASAPPSAPSEGDCFAVDSGAAGEWSGHAGAIACWSNSAWLFVEPPEGAAFRVRASGIPVVRTATSWDVGTVCADRFSIGGVTVVKGQQGAVPSPSGGTTIDAQARTAIGQILTVLRAHGLIAA